MARRKVGRTEAWGQWCLLGGSASAIACALVLALGGDWLAVPILTLGFRHLRLIARRPRARG